MRFSGASARELIIFKAFAARDQDWVDVQQIVVRRWHRLDLDHIYRELSPLTELKEAPNILSPLKALVAKLGSDFRERANRRCRAANKWARMVQRARFFLHPRAHMNKKNILHLTFAVFGVLSAMFLLPPVTAQGLSSSVPAGPQPTAAVTPLQTTPAPTVTVTPLPSASPSDTQPQTTNTVAPSPTASPAGTQTPQTTNTVAPSPKP